ncbi:unnamed protein product [Pedinophyceae sp. YPF-701]|nr:unnamed protein product [Pedinophyceae sp. YPF-701]
MASNYQSAGEQVLTAPDLVGRVLRYLARWAYEEVTGTDIKGTWLDMDALTVPDRHRTAQELTKHASKVALTCKRSLLAVLASSDEHCALAIQGKLLRALWLVQLPPAWRAGQRSRFVLPATYSEMSRLAREQPLPCPPDWLPRGAQSGATVDLDIAGQNGAAQLAHASRLGIRPESVGTLHVAGKTLAKRIASSAAGTSRPLPDDVSPVALADMSQVTALSVDGPIPSTPPDGFWRSLAWIGSLSKLRSLSLAFDARAGPRLEELTRELGAIEPLTQLTRLSLGMPSFSGSQSQGVHPLLKAAASSLRSLRIDAWQLDAHGLAASQACHHLTHLELLCDRARPGDAVAALACLPAVAQNLTSLVLCHGREAWEYRHLAGLTSLTSLHVMEEHAASLVPSDQGEVSAPLKQLAALDTLANLRRLSIGYPLPGEMLWGRYPEECLSFCARLRLEELTLTQGKLRRETARHIWRIATLTRLELRGVALQGPCLAWADVARLQRLQRLVFHPIAASTAAADLWRPGEDNVLSEEEVYEVMLRNRVLRHVDFGDMPLPERSARLVLQLPRLRSLRCKVKPALVSDAEVLRLLLERAEQPVPSRQRKTLGLERAGAPPRCEP